MRLFAGLREAAGVDRAEIDASNIGGLLEEACSRFGEGFAAGLPFAKVALNGRLLDEDACGAELTASDEVALLPPVSGGSSIGRR